MRRLDGRGHCRAIIARIHASATIPFRVVASAAVRTEVIAAHAPDAELAMVAVGRRAEVLGRVRGRANAGHSCDV